MTEAVQRLLQRTFDAQYGPMQAWLIRRTGDPGLAEDITAGAFVGLWRYLERGNIPVDPRGFLSVAASGLLKNHWRDQERREEDAAGLSSELDYLSSAAGHTWEDEAFTQDFDHALRTLPPAKRSAFILTDLRGLSTYEAAPLLGVSQRSAARYTSDARTLIQKELRT